MIGAESADTLTGTTYILHSTSRTGTKKIAVTTAIFCTNLAKNLAL